MEGMTGPFLDLREAYQSIQAEIETALLESTRTGRYILGPEVEDVEQETLISGIKVKKMCKTEEILLKNGEGHPAYPWRRHFHRGYPQDVIEKWMQEFTVESSSGKGVEASS